MASRWSMPPSRFKGRAVPVAWVDFEYPWKTVDPASQNTIERYLLTWLGLAVPRGVRLILIFDRGYARVELIKDLNHGQQPFLIRARRKLIVLLLGTDPFAEKLRPYFEQQRRKPRHGTCKVLSVLSIALQVLSDARWRQPARKRLMQILARLAQGCGVALLPAFSP